MPTNNDQPHLEKGYNAMQQRYSVTFMQNSLEISNKRIRICW